MPIKNEEYTTINPDLCLKYKDNSKYAIGGLVSSALNHCFIDDVDPLLNIPSPFVYDVCNKIGEEFDKKVEAERIAKFFEIDRILRNDEGRTTIVYWKDGTKTVAHCMDGEEPDLYMGFAACVMKKIYGTAGKAKKIIEEHDEETQTRLKAEAEKKEREKLAEQARIKRERAERKHYRRTVNSYLKGMRNSDIDDQAYQEAKKIYAKETEKRL